MGLEILVNPTELIVKQAKDEIGNNLLLFMDGDEQIARGIFVYGQAGLERFDLLADDGGQIATVPRAEIEKLDRMHKVEAVSRLLKQMLRIIGIDNVTLKFEEATS